ncbi:hypothetical protein [Streptomyces sp. NPDC001985]|uniref:hypothetical protein n=1 Tax=Streptomyces sp. NPDC001985 TaxID=3154406 RepID=UPI003332C77D
MATLLRVLIDQQGWNNYRSFAHQFRLAARSLAQESGEGALATLTLSESTFERWYFGKVTPQNDARRVLAHLFERPSAQLLSDAPSPSAGPSGFSGYFEFGASINDSCAGRGEDVGRLGRQVVMVARRAMDFAMGAEHGEVGQETLDHLWSEVRRLASIHLRVPVGAVLDDLAYIQNSTFRLLESGRVRPSQVRDLYLLASFQSAMLAKAGHDLADPQSAMMQARAAAVCADQAEHQTMRAWVRGLQAAISYWDERPYDALHYAQLGASVGEGLRGTLMVWLASQEARAAALLGDAETVHRANRRAQDLRASTSLDDLDSLGGTFYFPQARQDYFSVEASVLLGDGGTGAVRRAEAAVQGLAEASEGYSGFGAAAGSQCALTLARLQVGDLEGAAEAIRPVLDLPTSHRIAGVVGSVKRVQDSLRRGLCRDAVAARELREEIAEFGSHAALGPEH